MNVHSRNDVAQAKAAKSASLTLRERLQRMFRHTALIVTGVVLAAAGVTAAVFYIQSLPTTLKIAVGPPGSEDLKLVQQFAAYLKREGTSLRLNVMPQGSPADSSDTLEQGYADLAVVRRDLAMPKNGQALALLRRNVAVLIVPPPAPAPVAAAAKRARKQNEAPAAKTIAKIEDLKGASVVIVGRSNANVALLNAILAQYGITPDAVTVTQLRTENLTEQLQSLKFDAVLAAGPIGSKITAEAIAALARGKQQPKFLDIGSSEAIEQQNPIYQSTEIPAGAFGGSRPEEAVETIGFSHVMVARRTLDEQRAGDFTKHLFAAKQALGAENPWFTKIESPDTDKAASLAVHPGALAYLEGDQKTFMDRYSEPLYWGLMLLSFVGSGLAWLTSYARTSHTANDHNDLDTLIAAAKAARTATAGEELDRLGIGIDEVMERTIRHIEAAEIEQNRIAALTMAAEQAHRAIAERKAALATAPAPGRRAPA